MEIERIKIEQIEKTLSQLGIFLRDPAIANLNLDAEVPPLLKLINSMLVQLRADLRSLEDLKQRDPFGAREQERNIYETRIATVELDYEQELMPMTKNLLKVLQEKPEGTKLTDSLSRILNLTLELLEDDAEPKYKEPALALGTKIIDEDTAIFLEQHSPVTVLAWKPSEENLLSMGLRNSGILILDPWSGQGDIIAKAHKFGITCMSWSRDGKYLATGGADMSIHIWQTVSTPKHLVELIGTAGGILDLAWSPEGTMLISGGEDRCVRFWNINTAEPSRVSKLFGSWVDHVEWGQRGNKVVSSTKNGELQFWEPYNVSPSLRIDTKGRAISSLALSPDEELLGVSFENGTLDIYNTTSGAKVIPLDADGLPFDSLLFSQEGKLLAGSYKDRRVKVWRTDNWLPFLLKPSTPSKSRRKTVPASIMFWDDTICLAWFSDHDKKKVLIRKFNTSDIKHSRMPKPEAIPLSANEIQEAQRQFPDWDINEKGMSRLYTFSNFLAAIEFIQKCASVIDQYDHHPEWTNTFNRVHVTFTTVKIGKKLTKIDLQASRLLDAIFEREAED